LVGLEEPAKVLPPAADFIADHLVIGCHRRHIPLRIEFISTGDKAKSVHVRINMGLC
jgi:hypothetical protein